GLKEKALAAQRAGVSRVIAPKLNEPDLEDFPAHLLQDIEFVFADEVDRVLDAALEPLRSRSGQPAELPRRRRRAAGSRRAPAAARDSLS
ncbi:MAG: ATP-dependent Lon protease, partial [Thermoleophilaceae bacterium]|nr:ATP-dependent Lon protease [Thermoleophilaceae bacterium]